MRLGRSPWFAPPAASLVLGGSLAADGFSPLAIPGLALWLRPDMDVRLDAACEFNGSSQYLSLASPNPAGLGLTGTSFTIAAWALVDAATGTDLALGVYKYTTNERSYTLVANQSNGKFEFWLSSDGVNTTNVVAGSTYTVGAWHLVVARYNHGGGSNNLKLSVNGGANATATHTGGAFSTSTAPFVLGADSNLTNHFDGRLDSVGVWSRELSDGEVAQLYNGGAGLAYGGLDAGLKTSLVSWWNLDEASGNRVDAHGANHLAATGSPGRNAGLAKTAAVDEDPVAYWGDQHGQDQFAAQASFAKRPTLETTGLPRPLVTFDGSDDELALNAAWSATSGFCLAWVVDQDATPMTVLGHGSLNDYVRHVSATQVAVSNGTTTRTFTHGSQSTLAIHVVNGDGSALNHYLNGVPSSASGTSLGTISINRVGVRNPSTEFLNGHLGDVLAFGRPLTAAELNKLGRCLAQRHQLGWTTV